MLVNLASYLSVVARSNVTELLKRMDTRTHVRAKFSRICAKFKFLNAKLAKQALIHILSNLTKKIIYFYINFRP